MLTIKSNVDLGASFTKLMKIITEIGGSPNDDTEVLAFKLSKLRMAATLHVMQCTEPVPHPDPNDIPEDIFTASASDTEREIIDEMEGKNNKDI